MLSPVSVRYTSSVYTSRRWSDEDKKSWTKRMKKIANYDPSEEDADDGTFWMTCQDFMQNFATCYVVRRFPEAEWHRYGLLLSVSYSYVI